MTTDSGALEVEAAPVPEGAGPVTTELEPAGIVSPGAVPVLAATGLEPVDLVSPGAVPVLVATGLEPVAPVSPGTEPAGLEVSGITGAVALAVHLVQTVEVDVIVTVEVVLPVDTNQVVPELMVLVTGHTVVVV